MPTEDGWEPSPRIDPNSPLLVWRTVPGSDVNLQVRNDNAGRAMLAYAADYHAYVEPLVDRMTACYTPTNSVSTSNHLNATAMDFNWDYYPWKRRGNLNGAKLARLRELLDYWRGIMFWAGDWDDAYVDEMHHQMDYGSYELERSGQLGQWIKDHIRPDGFSTFKRGGIPGPPAANTGADVLARATGLSLDRAQQILPAVRDGLVQSQCTNVNRIAMWLAQVGHESVSFQYTEEIAKNGRYAPYIGRTWIQITWDYNYRAFSEWCHGKGLVPTPDYFVVNYRELADVKWAGIGAAWYWTVERPQINSLADQRNLVAVTQAINGGQNGAPDRKRRYDMALALGDQLLALTTSAPSGDDMSAADVARLESKIDVLLAEWGPRKLGPSRSFMATDGKPVESPLGFLYNIDGNIWSLTLTLAYLFDVGLAVQVVEKVARDGAYDGAWVDTEEFNAWLREFGQEYCQGLIAFKAALVAALAPRNQVSGARAVNVTNAAGPSAAEIASAVAALLPAAPRSPDAIALQSTVDENARLREENARLRVEGAEAKQQAVHSAVVVHDSAPTPDRSIGDDAAAVVSSVSAWTTRLMKMNPEELGALDTALKALKPPGGQS